MNNHRTWLSVAILSAIFATNANAQTEIDKLRSCLTIEDGSRSGSIAMMASYRQKPKPPLQRGLPTAKDEKEDERRLSLWLDDDPDRLA
jgi:hypothetical protein